MSGMPGMEMGGGKPPEAKGETSDDMKNMPGM
jgi:hypothetical protein